MCPQLPNHSQTVKMDTQLHQCGPALLQSNLSTPQGQQKLEKRYIPVQSNEPFTLTALPSILTHVHLHNLKSFRNDKKSRNKGMGFLNAGFYFQD